MCINLTKNSAVLEIKGIILSIRKVYLIKWPAVCIIIFNIGFIRKLSPAAVIRDKSKEW